MLMPPAGCLVSTGTTCRASHTTQAWVCIVVLPNLASLCFAAMPGGCKKIEKHVAGGHGRVRQPMLGTMGAKGKANIGLKVTTPRHERGGNQRRE